jgi:hypothetical protein
VSMAIIERLFPEIFRLGYINTSAGDNRDWLIRRIR